MEETLSLPCSGRKLCRICSTTTLKTKLVSELGNLAEEISTECIGDIDWFILATNNEMQVERDRLK